MYSLITANVHFLCLIKTNNNNAHFIYRERSALCAMDDCLIRKLVPSEYIDHVACAYKVDVDKLTYGKYSTCKFIQYILGQY